MSTERAQFIQQEIAETLRQANAAMARFLRKSETQDHSVMLERLVRSNRSTVIPEANRAINLWHHAEHLKRQL